MKDIEFKTLSYEVNTNGVAVITIDVKDRPVNVLTVEMYDDLHRLVDCFKEDDRAKAAVIQSGKESFFAGGDLKRLVNMYARKRSPQLAYDESRLFTTALRKLELCGKPIAVAVNGSAMGGGLELVLACNKRIVAAGSRIYLGLPEVTLGLLPGGGGTQRLARMLGVEKACDLVLSGRVITPKQALELGIIDAIVDKSDLFKVAEEQVLSVEDATRPWDKKGFAVPGGSGLNGRGMNGLFQSLSRDLSARYFHNYPAPIAALRAIFKGSSCGSMDKGLEIESREFSRLTGLVQTRNIIRSMFLNKGNLDRLQERPAGVEPLNLERLSVIGASALPEHLQSQLEKTLDKLNCSITPGVDPEADAVLLFGSHSGEEISRLMGEMPDAMFCVSCPSTLEETRSKDEFRNRSVGFNLPAVDTWQCVELGTLGGDLAQANLARAMDLTKQLRKTPTVQEFSGVWFSDVCKDAYLAEAEALLSDGASATLINNSARFASFLESPIKNAEAAATSNGDAQAAPGVEDAKQRLMYRQALAAVQFLAEGRISAIDADLVSLLGNGFPTWTGGVLSLVDSVGVEKFIADCECLKESAGAQFAPPAWLSSCGEEGIYPAFVE